MVALDKQLLSTRTSDQFGHHPIAYNIQSSGSGKEAFSADAWVAAMYSRLAYGFKSSNNP